MKKILSLFIICLVFLLAVPAFAGGDGSYVLDDAGLLTEAEVTKLNSKLTEVGERIGLDLVFLSSEDTKNMTTEYYAAYVYDNDGDRLNNRFGRGSDYSGVMLFVDMKHGEVYILGTGKGENYTTYDGVEYSLDFVWSYVKAGKWYEVGVRFADSVEYMYKYGVPKSSEPYTEPDTKTKDGVTLFGIKTPYTSSEIKTKAIISVVVGLAVALAVTLSMKSKMKTVQLARGASSYAVDDSFAVNRANDLFLYATVSKVARPKDEDNNHRSGGGGNSHSSFSGSSGTHHSGGGRSFR